MPEAVPINTYTMSRTQPRLGFAQVGLPFLGRLLRHPKAGAVLIPQRREFRVRRHRG
jgi:hypothetical protein